MIEIGDRVKIRYVGKFEDGEIFDSSRNHVPLEFTIGSGQVISGLDSGIVGMVPNERRSLTVPAEQAYGPYREELVADVDRAVFPQGYTPEVGAVLAMETADGQTIHVEIKSVEGDTVVLDANHPLAGKTLLFDVEVLEVSKGR